MAISPPREHPKWLKIPLNLSGPLGLGLSLLGVLNVWLGLGFTFVGVLYVGWEVYPDTYRFVRRSPIMALPVFLVCGAGLGFVAWLLVLKVAPPPQSERFYVAVGPSYIQGTQRTKLHGYTLAYDENGKYFLIPVHVAVYLRIKNLQNISSTIEKYGLEIKTIDGAWVRLIRVDSRAFPYLFFIMDGLEKVPQVRVMQLDSALTSGAIRPEDVVRGMAFFQYPPDTELNQYVHTYRVILNDGREFVSGEVSPSDSKSEGIQWAETEVLPGTVDLRNAQIKYPNPR